MVKVRTKDIIEKFGLELISGEEGINRPITISDISRPGIELAGFFDYYPADRIQMIGMTELTFAEKLSDHDRAIRLERLCTDVTPGIIITRDLPIPFELSRARFLRQSSTVIAHSEHDRLSGIRDSDVD